MSIYAQFHAVIRYESGSQPVGSSARISSPVPAGQTDPG
jgi:hypothetical protein